jgi:hypothetical protein
MEDAEAIDGEALPPGIGRPSGNAPSAGSGNGKSSSAPPIGELPAPRVRTQRKPLSPVPPRGSDPDPPPLGPPDPAGPPDPLAPIVEPPDRRGPAIDPDALPEPSTRDAFGPPEDDPATEELQFRPPERPERSTE